jgi:predicted Zn-dependent protease
MTKLYIPILCILTCFLSYAGGYGKTAMPLTSKDEKRAGDALVAAFYRQTGFVESGESTRIEEYLQRVGDKVAKNASHKLPYTFHLDPHPAFRSAVAYPGGVILVGGGALALMQHEDELAVVLGHEISHVDLNQCHQRLIEVMERDHLTSDQFAKLSIEDFGRPYGKDGELAADREGLKLAVMAGYSPHAAVELLELYQYLSREDKPAAPRTDSPSLEERIRQARDEIKSEGWDESKKEEPVQIP